MQRAEAATSAATPPSSPSMGGRSAPAHTAFGLIQEGISDDGCLYLQSKDLGHQEVSAIVDELLRAYACPPQMQGRSLPMLTQVTLSYNGRIGDKGAEHIARLLRSTPSLQSLYVAWCGLGPKGIQILVSGAVSLKGLYLGFNKIGNAGARHLADLIAANTALEHLGLAKCSIGDEGVMSIAQALENNTRLRTIFFNDEAITAAGARAAVEVILAGSNRVLEGLGFGGSEPFLSVERLWAEQRGRRPSIDTSRSLQ